MTEANIFSNARIGFARLLSGADEKPHDLFEIEKAEGGRLYGDYVLAFLKDDAHFNVEIAAFGYLDRRNAGELNPARRQHFSVEECLAAEQLIRSFFQPWRFRFAFPFPGSLFGRGVDFRPDWIIQMSADPERADYCERQLRAWRAPDSPMPSAGVSLRWQRASRQMVKRPRQKPNDGKY